LRARGEVPDPGVTVVAQALVRRQQGQAVHACGRDDDLVGGIAIGEAGQLHCIDDDGWGQRQHLDVAGERVREARRA